MKVLQVLLSPRIGGAESLAAGLTETWGSLGHAVATAFLDAETVPRGTRCARLRRLRNEVAAFEPDVVLAHSAIPNLYARLFVSRRIPVIAVLHSSADDYRSRLWRTLEELIAYYRSDPIVAVSQLAKNVYEQRFSGRNILVVPNGVQDPGYVPRTHRSPKRVVTLARVAPVKNPVLWQAVARALPRLDFSWYGSPNGDPSMEALVTQPELGSAGFKGAAPNVADVLATADILFHPSDRESLGLSVLEGILSGLPVVCSEAVSEVIGEELIAASFSAGDPRSAAEAIEQVTQAYRQHADQALDRREKALKSFGMTACALTYLKIFSEVLSSKPNSEAVP